MTHSERQERLFDTVQLAKEIYIHQLALKATPVQELKLCAKVCFDYAEIFIEQQAKYASNSRATDKS